MLSSNVSKISSMNKSQLNTKIVSYGSVSRTLINKIVMLEKDIEPCICRNGVNGYYKYSDIFKESLVVAEDNGRVIGYLCWFPISNDFSSKVLDAEDYIEDNCIAVKDVSYVCNMNNVLIRSLYIHPKYRGLGIGTSLVEALLLRLISLQENGNTVRDLLFQAKTKEYDSLFKKFTFNESKCILESEYTLYIL